MLFFEKIKKLETYCYDPMSKNNNLSREMQTLIDYFDKMISLSTKEKKVVVGLFKQKNTETDDIS